MSAGAGSPERLWGLRLWRYQKLTGHDAEQPAVGDSVLSWGLGVNNIQRSFQTRGWSDSVILNYLSFQVCYCISQGHYKR